jgi:hypothetical protein
MKCWDDFPSKKWDDHDWNDWDDWDDWDDWIKNQIDLKIRYLGIGIIGILEYLNTYSN